MDNRITEVETSPDAVSWMHDARYFYYPHGPLQRAELGKLVVQGMDYAYTLQGWLKGINGDRLDQRTDMGRDGDPSLSQNANLNVGRDAHALSLGYYGDADYKGIGSAWDDDQPATIAQRPFAPIGAAATTNTISEEHRPLHNGNIAHTVNSLQPFGLWGPTGEGQVLAQVYHYDQLNRLHAARAYTGLDEYNTWDGVADAVANRYRSMYEYDANGNITGAARFDGSGNWYDWLAYKYQKNGPRLRRNRLYQLNDLADQANAYVNESGGAQDIGWTDDVPFDEEDANMNTAYNYGYDALGNLVRDDREHIEAIEWTVAGKVKAVDHATGEGPDLAFAYGASGQRIMKQVSDPDADDAGYREHYIRDAQGNIMATYRYTNATAASQELNERPIYGSSRLGSYTKTMQLYNAQAITSYPPPSNIIQRPHLRYELTDQLGNVAAVITGRLLPSQSLAPFEADLVSAQGYEPFGSLLPGRNYNSGSYRNLFQGQEHDDELYGSVGTSYAFEYRMHDPRVGRFLSIDPLAGKYPHNSPYAFAENRVIDGVELEGLEWEDADQGVPSEALDSQGASPYKPEVIDRQIQFNIKQVNDVASQVGNTLRKDEVESSFITARNQDGVMFNMNQRSDGQESSVRMDWTRRSNLDVVAKAHNHPEGSAPSGADLSNMATDDNGRFLRNGNMLLVYGDRGTFSAYITNADKARAFLSLNTGDDIEALRDATRDRLFSLMSFEQLTSFTPEGFGQRDATYVSGALEGSGIRLFISRDFTHFAVPTMP